MTLLFHSMGNPRVRLLTPTRASGADNRPTGFHATTLEKYAEAFNRVLNLDAPEEMELRLRARTWAVQRFSQEEFERGWNGSGWDSVLASSKHASK
jgi:alpha-1,2-mannosyltransferase